MKPIPESVKERISNAEYYLEAADKHPSPVQEAVHILLLLVAWENIVIADAELEAWAGEEDIDEKVYKDHAHKFKDAPEITRNILGPNDTKPREVKFSTGREFSELRMACQYGSNTESKDVEQIFKTGWDVDNFRNTLIEKIGWVEAMVKTYEKL